MFGLKKSRFSRDLIDVYKYLMVGREEGGVRVISVMSSDRTKGVDLKQRKKKTTTIFHLNIRKCFCITGVVKCWNRLARDVVTFPPLEIDRHLTGHGPGCSSQSCTYTRFLGVLANLSCSVFQQ